MEFKRTLIIAEAGVNHNGRLDLALELCKQAKDSGADVVKFQTWITKEIISNNVKMANYQQKNTRNKESQFAMLKRLELSYDNFKIIKKYCDEIGIIFSSTADEEISLKFLLDLGIPFIKIGSGDINNIPYLRLMGSKNKPIILSTGMSYLSDVEKAVEVIKDAGATDITLLHCTTNYPCPIDEVNLKAITTLQKTFNLNVGYSDHTKGILIPIAAVSLGAKVIEKHFTLDCKMEGPDHIASTEPKEFNKMVKQIRDVEIALGNGLKVPNKSELEISKVVLKRIVAKKEIKKNDIFSIDNMGTIRENRGAMASSWDEIINSKALKNYRKGDPIEL